LYVVSNIIASPTVPVWVLGAAGDGLLGRLASRPYKLVSINPYFRNHKYVSKNSKKKLNPTSTHTWFFTWKMRASWTPRVKPMTSHLTHYFSNHSTPHSSVCISDIISPHIILNRI
jgi:hypothetical protein